MSACYLKQENYKRCIETADKVGLYSYINFFFVHYIYYDFIYYQALSYDQKNFKALFRKGKSLGELGYFEKAEEILSGLIAKNPSGML